MHTKTSTEFGQSHRKHPNSAANPALATGNDLQNICPTCLKSEFQWGWLHTFGQAATLKYAVDGNYSWSAEDGEDISARRCVNCGRLDLFAKA